ncbi:VWA domain-containing protein [Roseiconus nitratireducens]|uniref:VWA domain-containing protein n=2 Tax=Roseiconus nitratireducens TaxID=2605748 RepID=A0A5M6D0F1_9BACT|nr:VWA domain-containing protein [Roseiconus nitratireducens]
MMVLIVIMLVGLIATAAFSVDIALMHLGRAELRTATDAASKAASLELSRSLSTTAATEKGQEVALANTVHGDPLILSDTDFEFGRSEIDLSGRYVFTPDGLPMNSVRVTGRRTVGSASGPIRLMFGNVLGVEIFEPVLRSSATYVERDVVLVVDRSGSMEGDKFADLQSAISVFVNTLGDTPVEEAVGLASYNDTASEDVPLTLDLNEIVDGLAALRVGGRTSISRGMSAGASLMENGRDASFVERTMIVMTDGLHNEGPEPSTVATTLAAGGVQLHTITFGSGADQERMREIARIGRGRHYHALTATELRNAYREIALSLGTILTE